MTYLLWRRRYDNENLFYSLGWQNIVKLKSSLTKAETDQLVRKDEGSTELN